jgi:hypothetical protein
VVVALFCVTITVALLQNVLGRTFVRMQLVPFEWFWFTLAL